MRSYREGVYESTYVDTEISTSQVNNQLIDITNTIGDQLEIEAFDPKFAIKIQSRHS